MSPTPSNFQLDLPADSCFRFQLWYAGNKARRHITETRAWAVLDTIPGPVKNLKVLDAGTGWGYFAFLLAARGAGVTAIDFEIEDIKFGSRVRMLNGHSGAVRFCAANALDLPFPEASFDLTVSMEMVEHIPEPPDKVCRELARVTKPGGIVVLSTPNPKGLAQVAKSRLKRVSALRRKYWFLDYDEWFLSPAEIISAAAACGLRLVALRRTGLMVPFAPDWLFPLNVVVEKAFKVLPVLLTTNIFVFRKS